MNKYICISDSKEQFDINNESLGQSGERALYYSNTLHRKRIYRQSFPSSQKDMKLFAYKSKKRSQELCDEVNDAYGDDFYIKYTNSISDM